MVSTRDDLGDRIKGYETLLQQVIPASTGYVIRVDGRSFHTLTKHYEKPFDPRIEDAIDFAANALLADISKSLVTYQQSDEISVFVGPGMEHWFGGKVQKVVSVAAGIATAYFNEAIQGKNRKQAKPAVFDARVFALSEGEMANYLIWRQRDAIRNSIQSLAQSTFSHKKLHGKSTADVQEMLNGAGRPWEELSLGQRFGRISRRSLVAVMGDQGQSSAPVVRTKIKPSAVERKLTFDDAATLIVGVNEGTESSI